jgi:glutamate-1-semialdehyde 2,1-aminomutase
MAFFIYFYGIIMSTCATSEHLFQQAKKFIPGGVNSPVRAFSSVGGTPVYFDRGEGAYLVDVDGNRYLDFVSSWGPLILGHAHPDIIDALQKEIPKGLSFGAPIKRELEIAEKISALIPSIESVRMVNSGTEATMTAIRLARAYTNRNKILKFEGCYHGHVDALLVKAGSGLLTLGIPGTPGIPQDFTQHTLTADFNDINSVKKVFKEYGDEIAAVIIEPIAGNMGLIPGTREFLQGLRELCDTHHSLLIFDEVISGFRVGLGGAQAYYQITPDLTILGKIIGGGMPVGAFGGKKEIMMMMAPAGPVYQAGTLSGNPIALCAGLTTLNYLSTHNPYPALAKQTEAFISRIHDLAKKHTIALTSNQIGSMFSLFFTENPVNCYADVMKASADRYKQFFHGMLKRGFYFAPSAFETAFLSIAHTAADLDKALEAIDAVFSEISAQA